MISPRPSVFELRQYTLHPGRRDELIELFEREFIEPQEALGMSLPGLFRDAGRPDRFVWIRGFADMDARKAALEAFYGGPVWRAHREAANATMIDSDNVLLLRPAPRSPALPGEDAQVDGPLFCAVYRAGSLEDALRRSEEFHAQTGPSLTRSGARVVATFVTEPSPNTFPRLPVREGESVFVALVDRIARETLTTTQPEELVELVPTRRSTLRLATRARPDGTAR